MGLLQTELLRGYLFGMSAGDLSGQGSSCCSSGVTVVMAAEFIIHTHSETPHTPHAHTHTHTNTHTHTHTHIHIHTHTIHTHTILTVMEDHKEVLPYTHTYTHTHTHTYIHTYIHSGRLFVPTVCMVTGD